MGWRIFGLVDPISLQIIYIGVSRQPLHLRLAQHVYDARNNRGSRAKHKWLIKLIDRERKPIIIELAPSSDATWQTDERRWIARYRKLGYALVNEAAGGLGQVGTKHSKKVRAKISQSMLAYHASLQKTSKTT